MFKIRKGVESIVILIAEDDPDDQLMIKEAFEEAGVVNPVHFVNDGEELMLYLEHRGKYKDLGEDSLPGLMLIDLNMPKKDGREAIEEIKANPVLKKIPIVILTTSKAEEDMISSYNLGVDSFISKPVSFDALVHIIRTITKYWLEIVELPTK